MQTTIWTYPWDVADVGVTEALDDLLGRAGATGLSLAVSYHAGRFVQPRSPRRKVYFPEDGTIYFEPDWARYGRIKPQVASVVREQGDVFGQLAAERQRRGFKLNAWTVCLHNTRIGMAYPDVTARNAFGDPYYYSLCPSNPDARAYVTAMVADMTHRYRPDAVELESPTFMGFSHEYHHEKDGVGLNPREQFLLSLCFCEHCMAAARRAGVDADGAQDAVRREIAAACERPLPEAGAPVASLDAFGDTPALHAYLHWRFEPVTSLVREIRAAADPASRVYCLTGAPRGAWAGGMDLPAIAAACDGLVALAYGQDPDGTAQTVAEARRLVGEGGYVSAGLRLMTPDVTGPADLGALLAAAARGGADGVNLYNYGLVPVSRLDWVREAQQA